MRSLRDELIKSKTIATLCFLADVLGATNKLQKVLQGAQLNFIQVPVAVNKLIATLEEKKRKSITTITMLFF